MFLRQIHKPKITDTSLRVDKGSKDFKEAWESSDSRDWCRSNNVERWVVDARRFYYYGNASLESGEAEYPDLYIWHRKPAVGKATWVDYDDRGFLVAGGVIHKEYEALVTNLVANATEPLGMSQGIYRKDIKFDKDGVITEYKPFEFTFLPHKNACNSLTAFTTNEG